MARVIGRSPRPRRRAWTSALVVALAVVLGSPRGTATVMRVAPEAAADGVVLGPTSAGTQIRFSLVLHQPGVAALNRYLAGLQDPSSSDYHRYIDAATFGGRFGLSDSALRSLDAWLHSVRLNPIRTFEQRTQITVEGAAGVVEAALGIRLVNVLDAASGTVYHRPAGRIRVPDAIASSVDAIADLSNRPARTAAGAEKAVPGGAARPTDLAAAYDINPMYDAGFRGDGIFVAIVSFCSHLATDISAFENEYGIEDPPTGNAVTNVPVGAVPDCNKNARLEPTADIEIVRAIAPHANVLNFESSYTDSQSDVLNAIVADGRAKIVTDSYGRCYDKVAEGDRAAGLKALQAAYSHGITVFVASGDWGAFDCYAASKANHQLSVDWPSSTIYTTAVGGTRLDVRTDGAYYDEAAWADYLAVLGSGGGLNPVEDRPSWQHGSGVDNTFSNGKRQSPDVAASADINSEYSISYTNDGAAKGGLTGAYGTSLASPFWAAVTVLLQQHVAKGGKRIGFINPMLYDIAAQPGSQAFHDVTTGNNLSYPATAGWDYATGLGSPDVAALDAAVLAYVNH